MNFIEHAFLKATKRKWPHVYIAIDVHDTIGKGTYKKDNEGFKLYPWAEEVLQNLSCNPGVKLIIYTSSHEEQAKKLIKWLEDRQINIYALNENPDIPNTELCDFGRKFYFDVLFEDKAGFQGWRDWYRVMKELQKIGQWIPLWKDDGLIFDYLDKDGRVTKRYVGDPSYLYIEKHKLGTCDWNCRICNFELEKHLNENH